MTDDLCDLATESLQTLIPLMKQMGVRVVDLAPGRVATEVPFEGNGNHVGTMYAGVLFCVAEVLGGVVAPVTFDGSRFAAIVKGGTIRYLKPVTSAVRASAALDEATIARVAAEAEEHGKSDYQLTVIVTADGVEVASLVGDYQLRRV